MRLPAADVFNYHTFELFIMISFPEKLNSYRVFVLETQWTISLDTIYNCFLSRDFYLGIKS